MICQAAVRHETLVEASIDDVYALLSDIHRSAAHFPRLSALEEREGGWLWTLQSIGFKGVEKALEGRDKGDKTRGEGKGDEGGGGAGRRATSTQMNADI